MRSTMLLALVLTASTVVTLAPLSAGAQEPQPPQQTPPSQQRATPSPEIGFRSGFVRIRSEDPFFSETINVLSAPASFFGPLSGIHVTFFVTPNVALEPQVSLVRLSESGSTFSLYMLGFQPMFFMGPDANRAPYLFANVATIQQDDGGGSSEGQSVLGGGVGYRHVIRKSLALRYEFRALRRKGVDVTMTEIGILFGIGAVILPAGSP